MRPLLRTVLTAALLLAAPVAAAPLAHAGPAVSADEGRAAEPYVVTLAPGAAPERVMRETGVTEPRHVYRSVFGGFAADLDAAQLTALRAHPDVIGVERDGRAAGVPVEPTGPTGPVEPGATARR
ncbi:protease inhibitor I9 family protein [Streptomyces sp. NPDC029003]|uniref:protease inhibitor I9 family protein n=1 Tax=Streptomyces sp. NPDC029003 TaxID=3155125 RepID=UPI003408E0CC